MSYRDENGSCGPMVVIVYVIYGFKSPMIVIVYEMSGLLKTCSSKRRGILFMVIYKNIHFIHSVLRLLICGKVVTYGTSFHAQYIGSVCIIIVDGGGRCSGDYGLS